ncbi:MAG: NAD(P)/FAD-dependent oxidoreductase, partial [Gammaproteobacteria bacterium]|nr:NAD(P)/FAD-dependent oxidoreductase [Gammaproteobacteria bacterium]
MKIGIIGGGLMGLALAQRLGASGHAVSVFERATQVGGLATWQDFGEFVWDRYYHVILPSDAPLIRFINDIGLGADLRWAATKTGYYVDHQFYGLSNNAEFLKFPPLSLWSKFRLALTILYCARISDWRRLEKVPVQEWLTRTSGRATFEKFWKPLLLAKLGENYRRVSAVFIWSYIKRLFSARDGSAKKEHMGHVRGGYRTVFERLMQVIAGQGGEVRLGVEVNAVSAAPHGGMQVRVDGQTHSFDKVIFTGPVNVLRQVADPALVAMNESGRDVEYLGVICMVLATRKPFTPYYVLNIADERIPFTGVIGMSTIVDPQETAGLHLTYLPKYVLSDDPLLRAPEAQIRERFLAGLKEMFPDFDHADIQSVHVHRAIKVQPLQVIDYSTLVPQPRTRHADFYVLNTAQFVNNTLNNNEVIRTVNAFLERCGADFAPGAARATRAARRPPT